ncbi:MAG: hypothetical protein EXS18_02355 [Verrucomicrobiae bacterium]|nr:hypothetical protein [Verrucomicrobiae bacterium]
MSNRELVIDLVNRLPEDASLHDIAREIEFVAAVREGFDSFEREGGVSPEEAKKKLSSWLSK